MLLIEEKQNPTSYHRENLGFCHPQTLMFSEIRMLEILRQAWQKEEDLRRNPWDSGLDVRPMSVPLYFTPPRWFWRRWLVDHHSHGKTEACAGIAGDTVITPAGTFQALPWSRTCPHWRLGVCCLTVMSGIFINTKLLNMLGHSSCCIIGKMFWVTFPEETWTNIHSPRIGHWL